MWPTKNQCYQIVIARFAHATRIFEQCKGTEQNGAFKKKKKLFIVQIKQTSNKTDKIFQNELSVQLMLITTQSTGP